MNSWMASPMSTVITYQPSCLNDFTGSNMPTMRPAIRNVMPSGEYLQTIPQTISRPPTQIHISPFLSIIIHNEILLYAYSPDDEFDHLDDGHLQPVHEVLQGSTRLAHLADYDTENNREDNQTQHVRSGCRCHLEVSDHRLVLCVQNVFKCNCYERCVVANNAASVGTGISLYGSLLSEK